MLVICTFFPGTEIPDWHSRGRVFLGKECCPPGPWPFLCPALPSEGWPDSDCGGPHAPLCPIACDLHAPVVRRAPAHWPSLALTVHLTSSPFTLKLGMLRGVLNTAFVHSAPLPLLVTLLILHHSIESSVNKQDQAVWTKMQPSHSIRSHREATATF